MRSDRFNLRYRELQQYVGWCENDALRVRQAAEVVEPHFPSLIDDFYAEIERHPDAQKVITGGADQVARLKGTLLGWLRDLFSGCYDREYVNRRWNIGRRHVEIGLGQAFPDAALSRLRRGLVRALGENGQTDPPDLARTVESLNLLLDLELAIIHEAYEDEYTTRIQSNERLAAIGQVAGGIAHELRNPLNAVKTSAYYLTNARNPSPEKTAEHLSRIDRQVTLADAVVTTLSDFAKLPIPKLKPIVVVKCIGEALQNHQMPKTVQLSLALPESLPRVEADSTQIQIVFGNLIRNALDAMSEGGRLEITAHRNDDSVAISFADTGVGIASDDLGKIMEPLFSTKARGIGLGLAITRAILDKHDGGLFVESELGKGSTFTVRLKAADD